MAKSPFSRSQKKYIRNEKARLRREVSDPVKREELILGLLQKFLPKAKEEKQKRILIKNKEDVAVK